MEKKKLVNSRSSDPEKEEHSQLFCAIRDGLLEAIKLEKNPELTEHPLT